MYYKIQKSLGNISAVLTDNIPNTGTCIEFKNFKETDASIVVYKDCKPVDLSINGCVFPCVYNNITRQRGSDIYGGDYYHEFNFEFIDSTGSVQCIEIKRIYGEKESLAVEYFYSFLYNISCCKDMEQCKDLYRYIIDNDWFNKDKKRKEAVEVLNFIESFTPQLSMVKDSEFLAGLKQKIQVKFKEAKDIIASSTCPE